jgi:predicted Zn-dependent peptidase
MRTRKRFVGSTAVALACALALAGGLRAQVRSVDKLRYPALRQTEIPQPVRVVLDNGMVVMLLEDHELPLIDVSARIRTGSRWEPADKIGLASLTGTVLRTGGTTSMTGDEVDDFLEGRAASIETGIGTTSGTASMSCLEQDFADVLKVFADVLRHPVFDEDKIQVAKTQIEAAIARQNDQPNGITFREFDEIVYGADSPYAWNETYDTVANIGRDDLIAWHARYFRPDRIILGLVGDFDAGEARALVEQTFRDWPKGPEAADPEAAYRKAVEAGVYYVEKNDMTQSNVIMGHLGIERDNPDYYAVEVLNQVLSGSFASRLFVNVRSKKALAYAVSGGVGSNWDYPGTFRMFLTTKVETTAAGIDALIEEARDLTAEPPTDEEVEKAKGSLLNSFVFEYDSTREVLDQQLTYEYYGYPLDWLQRYNQGIRNVTTAQVRAAAEKHIHPDRMAILVVGPKEGQDRPLSEFGKVAVVDITIPEPSAPQVAESSASLARGRDLVALAVEAMGGAARLDSVSRLDHAGSVVVKTPQGEMQIRNDVLIDFVDQRMRQEMTLPFGKVAIVLTATGGFVQSPQGSQPLPDSQRQDLLREMHREPILVLKNRDRIKANAVGPGQAGGVAVEKVVVEWEGETATYGIDPASGRILSLAYRGRVGMNPQPGDVVRTFADFREVSGLVLPFSASASFNGEPAMSATLDSVKIDGPLDEAAFAMPQGAAAADGGR